MRFKIIMINNLGNLHEETVISNNDEKEKSNGQTINSKLKVLDAKWIYK